MKRILAMITVLLLIVTVFSGCGKQTEKAPVESVESQVEVDSGELFTKNAVSFLDGENSRYTIVRPQNVSAEITQSASFVFKQLRTKLGVSVKNELDSEDGNDRYEILIGLTNRTESQEAYEYLKKTVGGHSNDFLIASCGKKIVIMGMTDSGTDAAVKYFVDNYLTSETIEGGIFYTQADTNTYASHTLCGVQINEFTIVKPHYNASYIYQIELEKLQKLFAEEFGYKVDIKDDWGEGGVIEGKYEIIVGNANRSGVSTVNDRDKVEIRITDSKVYLNGGHTYSTAAAVTEFYKMIKSGNVGESDSKTFSYATLSAEYDGTTTFKPTWYDDFDGNAVDTKKWTIQTGFGREGKHGKYSGMNTDPAYVYVSDGKFTVQGVETETQYLGGEITTDPNKMNYRYGYIEYSAIIPGGDGFWSLMWMCGVGAEYSSPEIDVNECFGNASVIAANCHAWPTSAGTSLGWEHTSLDKNPYSSQKEAYCPDGKKFCDDFHTYGMDWTDTYMAFTVDGEVFFTYDTTQNDQDVEAFINTNMNVRIAFSVGRDNNGLDIANCTLDEWQESSRHIVDYVYLFQKNDGKSRLAGTGI